MTLAQGSGARRLAEVRCRAAIQLLIVQASWEIYAAHSQRLPQAGAILMLDALAAMAQHARAVDADLDMRRLLAAAQVESKVRILPLMPLRQTNLRLFQPHQADQILDPSERAGFTMLRQAMDYLTQASHNFSHIHTVQGHVHLCAPWLCCIKLRRSGGDRLCGSMIKALHKFLTCPRREALRG